MSEEIRQLLKLMQARVLEALSEIPDERLHWKPSAASTSPAEIVWHMANTERRLAALIQGVDPATIDAEAGTRAWIEGAGHGAADLSGVPSDRKGLERALTAARRGTLAALNPLSAEELQQPSLEWLGEPRSRSFFLHFIAIHHSYHAGQLFTLGALIRGGLK